MVNKEAPQLVDDPEDMDLPPGVVPLTQAEVDKMRGGEIETEEEVPAGRPEKTAEVIDERALRLELDKKKSEERRLKKELKDFKDHVGIERQDDDQLVEDARLVRDAVSYRDGTSFFDRLLDPNYRKAGGAIKDILGRYTYYRKPEDLYAGAERAKEKIKEVVGKLEKFESETKAKLDTLWDEIDQIEKKLRGAKK